MDIRRECSLAVWAAMVMLIGAGVAYASNSAPEPTSTGGHGAQQVAGQDDSDGPGDAEEPGGVDGADDTED